MNSMEDVLQKIKKVLDDDPWGEDYDTLSNIEDIVDEALGIIQQDTYNDPGPADISTGTITIPQR